MLRDRLTTTAYHEAGHAILAWAAGYMVQVVSIEEIDDSLGRLQFVPLPPGETNTMRSIIMGAGGMAADMIHWQENGEAAGEFMEGGDGDRDKMEIQLYSLGFRDPIAVELCIHAAINYMRRDGVWMLVDEIAQALLSDQTLSSDQIVGFARRVPLLTEADIAAVLARLLCFKDAGIRTVEQVTSSPPASSSSPS